MTKSSPKEKIKYGFYGADYDIFVDIKKKSDIQNIVNSSMNDQHIKILSISISRFHRSTYRDYIDQQIEILLLSTSDRLRKNQSTAIVWELGKFCKMSIKH